MRGKGKWTDEFIKRAREIPDVEELLITHYVEQLKKDFLKVPKTPVIKSGLNRLFGFRMGNPEKERIIDEAIEKLREATINLKEGEAIISPNGKKYKIDRYNVIHEVKTPIFGKINTVSYPGDVESEEVEKHIKKFQSKLFNEFFSTVFLDDFKRGDSVDWGDFNTVYINVGMDKNFAHVALLIRTKKPDPSEEYIYTFYDPTGTPYKDEDSPFYKYRHKLDYITKGGEVDQNNYIHQCKRGFCATFSTVRATYPKLNNEAYNAMLRDVAISIVKKRRIDHREEAITTHPPIIKKYPHLIYDHLVANKIKQPFTIDYTPEQEEEHMKGFGKCRKCGKLKIN
jgi:hypothetical protein